jgi:hypothetical protein
MGTGIDCRNDRTLPLRSFGALLAVLLAGTGCGPRPQAATTGPVPDTVIDVPKPTQPAAIACTSVVTAHVAALEQVYAYNRYGSFNPQGLVYALRRDVVTEPEAAGPGQPISLLPSTRDEVIAGRVQLRPDKRPRPLVLRVNEGDCLEVTFTNLLSPREEGEDYFEDPATGRTVALELEEPATRSASIHVNGLDDAGDMRSDGANVGRNPSGLVAPGQSIVYRWYARAAGTYLMFSAAAPVGGEGDGGQLGLGLFGAINVEPRGSVWYRSQVTADDMARVTLGQSPLGTPIIDYDKERDGVPVLALRDRNNEIVHGDLNAIIANTEAEECGREGPGNTCKAPFREFSAIFHDETTVEQAFPELDDETNPIHQLRDGMAINYGSSGMGAMVLANRDPTNRYASSDATTCVECKLEEFFLTAWVVGDPAMVLERDSHQRAVQSLYADDPSNVHHSYMGDPVRFRNIHAGPKETHVFHLHAHQWVRDWTKDDSVYLDSQTISPGAAFTYQIHYGGSGNRNVEVGDSIFHCHLYPHFAQGMWGMWRSHDVFENGTPGLYDPAQPAGATNQPGMRNLPDAELTGGSPNPAVVPIPGRPLPPMPSAEFRGYPFYIAGRIGHRPPQAPRDLDVAGGRAQDGGLPRHVIVGGDRKLGVPAVEKKYFDPSSPQAAVKNAIRVKGQNGDPRLFLLAAKLDQANLVPLDASGTADEQRAQKFHAGALAGATPIVVHKPGKPSEPWWSGRGYPSCDSAGRCYDATARPEMLFAVNGQPPEPGAPFADPCPTGKHERTYRAAYVQYDMPVNQYGWHDPQARIIVLEDDVKKTLDGTRPAEPFFFRANSDECVVFKATNLVPSVLNLDDFQVYSPTDTIGQHIHLVKFDVTSSDGSANGWNYEDSTFSADEVRERLIANRNFLTANHVPLSDPRYQLRPRRHRMFESGPMAGDPRGDCPASNDPSRWDDPAHPWCGAQTTVQRWWADPLLDNEHQDRTIRTVFTHDHLGPSSHQHHGLYAALVVEPAGSSWQKIAGGAAFGGVTAAGAPIVVRDDGGPTSFAANIVPGPADTQHRAQREFNLAFADFSILYTQDNHPVNPPNLIEHDLPVLGLHDVKPRPEGISTADPGTQVVNYRNDPMPLRFGRPRSGFPTLRQKTIADARAACTALADVAIARAGGGPSGGDWKHTDVPRYRRELKRYCDPGDLANVFSSRTHGDPWTPLLEAFEGDRVSVRLIQGAQEENHVFTLHGVKWLAQPDVADSGYVNGQPFGISEHFEFEFPIRSASLQIDRTDYLYHSSATDNLWDGQWGLLRTYAADGDPKPLDRNPLLAKRLGFESLNQGVARLPDNPKVDLSGAVLDPLQGSNVCPEAAPRREFHIVAARAMDLVGPQGPVYNRAANLHDANAIVFFDASNEARLRAGKMRLEPLILRANAGDCIQVQVDNRLPAQLPDPRKTPSAWTYNMLPPIIDGFNSNDFIASSRTGLHAQLLSHSTYYNGGSNVGFNTDSTVRACEAGESPAFCHGKLMTWYAGDFVFSAPAAVALGKCRKEHPAPHACDALLPVAKPIEFGVVGLTDLGDVIQHSTHGALGALVVEPLDARAETDCQILEAAGAETADCLSSAATVTLPDGTAFREFVAVLQDNVSLFRNGEPQPNLRVADDAEDTGQKAFNYRTEPLWNRVGASPSAELDELAGYDWSNAFSSFRCADGSAQSPCADGSDPVVKDPETPLFTVEAGMPVRVRLVHPLGHPRNHGFSVAGHNWHDWPWSSNSSVQVSANDWDFTRLGSVNGVGPARHFNLLLDHAGGEGRLPGDYLYRAQDSLSLSGGQWGLVRVLPACGARVRDNRVCR